MMNPITSLLLIAVASAAVYWLIREACRGADTLAESLTPPPPTSTLWRYVCMSCALEYRRIRIGYDPVHGPEAVSHGLCSSCYAHRMGPAIEIDLGDSREDVAAALSAASEREIEGVTQ